MNFHMWHFQEEYIYKDKDSDSEVFGYLYESKKITKDEKDITKKNRNFDLYTGGGLHTGSFGTGTGSIKKSNFCESKWKCENNIGEKRWFMASYNRKKRER